MKDGPLASAGLDVGVDELVGDIDLARVVELGKVIEKLGPGLWRWQAIPDERIDVRRFAGRWFTHRRAPASR